MIPAVERILERPLVYRLWQSAFVSAKIQPLLANSEIGPETRVLDVGCGPGTNAGNFPSRGYLGLDINARYVADASRRFPRHRFTAADVTAWDPQPDQRFDVVVINSFLHHLDDEATRRVLSCLAPVIAGEGHLHVLELVRPAERSIARWLASMDRGRFSRSVVEWERLCGETYAPVVVQPYSLKVAGTPFWKMVYLKCRPLGPRQPDRRNAG